MDSELYEALEDFKNGLSLLSESLTTIIYHVANVTDYEEEDSDEETQRK